MTNLDGICRIIGYLRRKMIAFAVKSNAHAESGLSDLNNTVGILGEKIGRH